MKNTVIIPALLLLLFTDAIQSQQQVIPLWPGAAPGSEAWTQKEVQYFNPQKQQMVRNVVTPSLTVYSPDSSKANGTAVIIAPGGGFLFLSWQTEGTEVAEWLAERGITAFVLKYRTTDSGSTQEEFQQAMGTLFKSIAEASKPGGNINQNAAMSDAAVVGQADGRQALRIVRERAAQWGINPSRIGIMGFSAGGMVTLGTLLQNDEKSRPDFAAAIYTPWSGGIVPANAPPLFILVAGDDGLTAPGSQKMYSAWKDAGKQTELHVYSKGGHGFGMQKRGLPIDTWIDRFGDWLVVQGFMAKH
jgi:acetyl esterase/lipase